MSWRNLRGTIRKGGPATRGYRLVRGGRYRNWLLHRAVVDTLLREWNYYGWTAIPPGWEVHHIDFDRANCDPFNLLLLEPALHHALQKAAPRCPYTGRYVGRVPYAVFDEAYIEELLG